VAAVKAAWQCYLADGFHTGLLPDVGSTIRLQDSSRVQLFDYVHSEVVSTQRDTSTFDRGNDGDVLPDSLFASFILLQGADNELCPIPRQDQLFVVFGAWSYPTYCWLHVSAYDMAFHWRQHDYTLCFWTPWRMEYEFGNRFVGRGHLHAGGGQKNCAPNKLDRRILLRQGLMVVYCAAWCLVSGVLEAQAVCQRSSCSYRKFDRNVATECQKSFRCD
jgi:hypothetical protein